MALIVENGSGLPNADSYVSVADADVYLERYGHAEWVTATGAEQLVKKEVALRQATRFVDNLCRAAWIGVRGSSSQALGWPRKEAYDDLGVLLPDSTVPDLVRYATCEMASRFFSGPAPDADLPRGGHVKRKKTDVLETEYFSRASNTTIIPVVFQMLAGLTRSSLSGFGSVLVERCL